MWASILFQNMVLFFGCSVLFAVLFGIKLNGAKRPKLGILFSFAKFLCLKLVCRGPLNIRAVTNDRMIALVKPILKSKPLTAIQEKITPKIEEQVRVSGRAQNPRILSQQSAAYMTLSFFAVVPASIAFGFFGNWNLLFALLIPPAWLFYPRIKLYLAISERKASVDGEMAFFVLYASAMQSIGRSLYDSMVDVVEGAIFPTLENEGKMLSRNVHLFGLDQLTALNEHGLSHPDPHFKNLLLGYVSISKSGGDLARYMERKSEEFFHRAQFRYANYKSHAGTIGETMLILLTILPMMILVSSFLLAEESAAAIANVSFVLVPAATAFMILMINASQPKTRNSVDLQVMPILAGVLASGALLAFNQQPWLVVGAGFASYALLNFAICLRQFREILHVDSALPDFFRDVTEYRKIGIPISNAIMAISESRKYNACFDRLLGMVSVLLRHGHPLSAAVDSIPIRSWTAKTSFFVLGKVADSGGGTAEILEQITGFSSDVNQTKNDTRAGISMISYFALTSPVMMAYTTKEMAEILAKLNSGMSDAVYGSFGVQTMLVSSQLIGDVNLLNVISAISLGLVMAKLTHFTVRHTVLLGMSVLISLISIMSAPMFPSLVRI